MEPFLRADQFERLSGLLQQEPKIHTKDRACWRPDALSAVEHRPADVVPQPLVVQHEFANRLR